MTVLMTLTVPGDGTKLEQMFADSDMADRVIGMAKKNGLISHHFYATDSHIMVLDEWPAEENFHAFFTEAGGDIQQIMSAASDSTEPEIRFWRKLSTGDDVG